MPILVLDNNPSDAGVYKQRQHPWAALVHAGCDLVDHLSHLIVSSGTVVGEARCLPFQVVFVLG